jgi:endonuclease YncB( thermonuclease family)
LHKIIQFKRRLFNTHPRGRVSRSALSLAVMGILLGVVGTVGYFKFLAPLAIDQTNFVVPTVNKSTIDEQAIIGRASVIDGDTIEIHGTRIRLYGIDAPESDQTCIDDGNPTRCGQRAALALADKIAEHSVNCEPKDRDRYGRVVAICRSAGEDLNAWMVTQGMAVAYRQYSSDYILQEERAKVAKRGIWKGDFVFPWDWRHDKENHAYRVLPRSFKSAPAAGGSFSNAQSSTAASGQCLIKGNISQSGERIYHVPGGAFYDRTIISVAKGERWFCSEAEAQAAGWRRSRR